MSATDPIPPHIYGTLILRDVPHARAVLQALGGKHADIEDDDDVDGTLEELLHRIANLVDEVFRPTPAAGGPFSLNSEVYLTGPGSKPGMGGLINVRTEPAEFAQSETRSRAEKFLDLCANVGVTGYIEIDAPGKYSGRTVHVLTPAGLFTEIAPSRFDNV